MAEMKLMRKDGQLVLNWRRKDRDMKGQPKNFKNLMEFNRWWNFIESNVPSMKNCKNPSLELVDRENKEREQSEQAQRRKEEQQALEQALQTAKEMENQEQARMQEEIERRQAQEMIATQNDRVIEQREEEKQRQREQRRRQKLEEERRKREAEERRRKYRETDEETSSRYKELSKQNKELQKEINRLKRKKCPTSKVPKPFAKPEEPKQIELEKVTQEKCKKKTRHVDDGYHYLPPKHWMIPQPKPPVCITDKRCPVCPQFTQTNPVGLMTSDMWGSATFSSFNATQQISEDNKKYTI